jgi:hypothetical protein
MEAAEVDDAGELAGGWLWIGGGPKVAANSCASGAWGSRFADGSTVYTDWPVITSVTMASPQCTKCAAKRNSCEEGMPVSPCND